MNSKLHVADGAVEIDFKLSVFLQPSCAITGEKSELQRIKFGVHR